MGSGPRVTPCALALLVALIAAAPARAYTWEPVPAADLALTAPRVEPGADAEVLLWRVLIDDRVDAGVSVTNQEWMVRLKLFGAGAVQKYATIRLAEMDRMRILELNARTVLPDGRILPVPANAIFEEVVAQRGESVVRRKSFVPPGLVPGAIVEYHVMFQERAHWANFMKVPLQLGYPVKRLELRLHPFEQRQTNIGAWRMKYRTFQHAPVKFVMERSGDHLAVIEDLPAFQREPLMPPDDLARSWLLLYYAARDEGAPKDYWRSLARERHADFLERTKPDTRVREAALAATAGVSDTLECVRRLYDLCRTRVSNVWTDTMLTDSERGRRKPNESPGETLRHGIGTGPDIRLLFASLARGCGLDPRLVLINPRTVPRLDLNFTQPYLLSASAIGFQVGGGWYFLDPSETWLPFGMLTWQVEGADAIITGPGEPLLTMTPLSDQSCTVRTSVADLTLAEDGTLEGAVRITLTGHLSASSRQQDHHVPPAERIEQWTRDLGARVGTLELRESRFEVPEDPAAPYRFTCRVRAPGYAQVTDRRLVLQPALFRRAMPAVFAVAERRHPVSYQYPWSELDSVRIHLPEGFTAEAQSEPAPLVIRDVGRYELRIRMLEDGRTLLAVRTFDMGEGGNLIVPASAYPTLKQVFDAIRERDGATLVLARP